jgi:multiple sugar transport system ATP-binding protein
LQQCASPRELFSRPANAFVAGFIGSPAMNLLPATIAGEDAVFGTLTIPLSPEQRAAATSPGVTVGVRPEAFAIRAGSGLDALVEVVEELGSESYLYCTVEGHEQQFVARTEGLSTVDRGDRISLVPTGEGLHLFDTATGERLPA